MDAEHPERSRAGLDAFYLLRTPIKASASVAVQSRWGNLYQASAEIRSLAVDVYRHTQVKADICVPAAAPVRDRLPTNALRLWARDLPAPPLAGRHRVLLTIGQVTDLVPAKVTLIPRRYPDRNLIHVLITLAARGVVFGLDPGCQIQPAAATRRPARRIQLSIDAVAAQVTG
jgi:hypothetical protein